MISATFPSTLPTDCPRLLIVVPPPWLRTTTSLTHGCDGEHVLTHVVSATDWVVGDGVRLTDDDGRNAQRCRFVLSREFPYRGHDLDRVGSVCVVRQGVGELDSSVAIDDEGGWDGQFPIAGAVERR